MATKNTDYTNIPRLDELFELNVSWQDDFAKMIPSLPIDEYSAAGIFLRAATNNGKLGDCMQEIRKAGLPKDHPLMAHLKMYDLIEGLAKSAEINPPHPN